MGYNQEKFPLYDASFEHDSCGIGAVISIRGEQTHRTVDDALKIVEKLQHRAGRRQAAQQSFIAGYNINKQMIFGRLQKDQELYEIAEPLIKRAQKRTF